MSTPPLASLAHLGLSDAPPDTSGWRAEVTTADVGGDRWSTNALRFPDREEALEYARDLAGRWMLVTRWRAVDDTVPLNQPYEAGSEDGAW
jgi:hypothetical protein